MCLVWSKPITCILLKKSSRKIGFLQSSFGIDDQIYEFIVNFSTGTDFHSTMMAAAPREKLLVGRRGATIWGIGSSCNICSTLRHEAW